MLIQTLRLLLGTHWCCSSRPLDCPVGKQEGTWRWTHQEERAEAGASPQEGLCTQTLGSESPSVRRAPGEPIRTKQRVGWETHTLEIEPPHPSSYCWLGLTDQTIKRMTLRKLSWISFDFLVFYSLRAIFPFSRNITWQRILCKKEREKYFPNKGEKPVAKQQASQMTYLS